jgi:hypothetical protein
MIQFHDEQNHRELMLTPLLFTPHDNYLRSSKSFQGGLKFGCLKPTKNQQFMFNEAVKNDLENSKETQQHNIKHTLSHHCVI